MKQRRLYILSLQWSDEFKNLRTASYFLTKLPAEVPTIFAPRLEKDLHTTGLNKALTAIWKLLCTQIFKGDLAGKYWVLHPHTHLCSNRFNCTN